MPYIGAVPAFDSSVSAGGAAVVRLGGRPGVAVGAGLLDHVDAGALFARDGRLWRPRRAR